TLDQRRRAAIGLQMPRLSAAAHASRLGIIDDDVSALAAVAVFTIDREIADDDSAADARTEREHHDAVIFLPAADPRFAERGGVGIVGKRDRQAERLGYAIANRKVMPVRQIVWLKKHPL